MNGWSSRSLVVFHHAERATSHLNCGTTAYGFCISFPRAILSRRLLPANPTVLRCGWLVSRKDHMTRHHRNVNLDRVSVLVLVVLSTLCQCTKRANAAGTATDLLYVATFTDHGSGRGIYSYRFDPSTGQLASLGLAAETANPEFIAVHPGRQFLYAVNFVSRYREQEAGSVSAFAIEGRSGSLTLLNQVSAHDIGPAHITVDHTGKYVLVANYPRGSVAMFPVLANGGLGEPSAFVQHKGSSVDPQRQRGPHAHAVEMSPDNRFVLVADLGMDQLLVYPFEVTNGTLGTPRIVAIDPGSGPRHLTFGRNGKFVYLLNELRSTISAFSYHASDGVLSLLQTISTLPSDFSGKSTAGEIAIHPSGRFLYASNRGNDTIAVFAVDAKLGTLSSISHTPTGGKTPRSFTIDPSGKWLLAANQDSNNIASFRIDAKTGRISPKGQTLEISAPACIELVTLP